MWDSPSWLNSAISAKINREVASADRLSKEMIAAEDRKSRETVTALTNASNEAIAKANRESNEAIEAANRANAINVAMINAASKAVPKLVPLIIGGNLTKDRFNNNSQNNSGSGVTNSGVATTKVSTAQKKADDAFPTLTPTFREKVSDLASKITFGSRVTAPAAIGAGTLDLVTQTMLPILL